MSSQVHSYIRLAIVAAALLAVYFAVMLTPLIIAPAIYGFYVAYRKYVAEPSWLARWVNAPLRSRKPAYTKRYLVVIK